MVLYTISGIISYTDLNNKDNGFTLQGKITNIINKQEKLIFIDEHNFDNLKLSFNPNGLSYEYDVEA